MNNYSRKARMASGTLLRLFSAINYLPGYELMRHRLCTRSRIDHLRVCIIRRAKVIDNSFHTTNLFSIRIDYV